MTMSSVIPSSLPASVDPLMPSSTSHTSPKTQSLEVHTSALQSRSSASKLRRSAELNEVLARFRQQWEKSAEFRGVRREQVAPIRGVQQLREKLAELRRLRQQRKQRLEKIAELRGALQQQRKQVASIRGVRQQQEQVAPIRGARL
ncbi:hypothetical protein SCP_0500360 [Sparassis crispa]|uniref:Uncharacterized protein n=1 Tax=Sparassis crispa TaxID=139825 RepID=A0A401GLE0_9APHY|nr:hypothetical protein SCP_0500360 [Sparassis crispa]GBE82993.1 hypothetical protein SCP_0500360 [Sparassis crispa]